METCEAILSEHCQPVDYVIGNSKVFMKDYVPDKLRLICEIRASLMLQALVRCRLAKEKLDQERREKERKRKSREVREAREKAREQKVGILESITEGVFKTLYL